MAEAKPETTTLRTELRQRVAELTAQRQVECNRLLSIREQVKFSEEKLSCTEGALREVERIITTLPADSAPVETPKK